MTTFIVWYEINFTVTEDRETEKKIMTDKM